MKCVYQLGVAVIICVLMCFAIFDAQGEAAPDRQNEVVAEASPAVLLMERLQAAAKDAQASDAGKRAAAVVVLRKIAADIAASPVMRHEALFRIAQVRELDKAHPEIILAAYREASAAMTNGEYEEAIGLRVAALLASQKDSRGARQILEPLADRLDKLPREIQIGVLTQLAAVLVQDGDQAGSAACTVRMIDRGLIVNETQEVQLYLRAAAALDAAGEVASAVAVVEKLLERVPALSHVNYKSALLWLVQRYLAMPDPDGAVATLRLALDRPHDFPPADTLDLRLRIAVILRTGKGDITAAREECQDILKSVNALPAASRGVFKNVYDGVRKELATIYLESGESDALISLVEEVLADTLVSSPMVSAMIALVQPVVATNRAAADRLIDSARRCVAMNVANAALGDSCQQAIVEILLAQREREVEALQEARVFFRTAQVSKLGEATDLVVRAFKQSDRNLARANAFLRYLRHGVDGVDGKAGTEDDLADPLAALPIISRDDARNLVYSAALARQTDDWVGLLARARLLAYMDRSLEAFDTMTQAFARCPPQEKLLQPVVDELATLVMRVTRDEGLGRQVVDYIMYGAHGEDGKAGTEDDSGDVFAMVAKRLAITQEVSNHGQIGQ